MILFYKHFEILEDTIFQFYKYRCSDPDPKGLLDSIFFEQAGASSAYERIMTLLLLNYFNSINEVF